MAKKERRKIMQAGRLWMAVQYRAVRTQSSSPFRTARLHVSSPAREALNARQSWQKLRLLLAANFQGDDLVVSLTYRDDALPKSKEEADKRLTAFIRSLRAHRAATGDKLAYIRITEHWHGDGRIHHHMVLNATGDDYAIIRKLWQRNGDQVDFELVRGKGLDYWAHYLTKEPREKGRPRVGERTWRASLHMIKPTIQYDFVPEGAPLFPPPRAMIVDNETIDNTYGSYHYVTAWLPETDTTE